MAESYASLESQVRNKEDDGDFLTQLTQLGNELNDLRKEITKDEDALKAKVKKARFLSESTIPTMLQDRGMTAFTLQDGTSLVLKQDLKCKIPEGQKEEAMAWLEEHGHGGSIKRTILIDFTKGEDKWADKFQRDCAQRKKPLNLKRTKTIHHGTLKSLLNECLERGIDVPMKPFGIFRQNIIKITTKAS